MDILPQYQQYLTEKIVKYPEIKWYEIYVGSGMVETRLFISTKKALRPLLKKIRNDIEPFPKIMNSHLLFDFQYYPWHYANIGTSKKSVH